MGSKLTHIVHYVYVLYWAWRRLIQVESQPQLSQQNHLYKILTDDRHYNRNWLTMMSWPCLHNSRVLFVFNLSTLRPPNTAWNMAFVLMRAFTSCFKSIIFVSYDIIHYAICDWQHGSEYVCAHTFHFSLSSNQLKFRMQRSKQVVTSNGAIMLLYISYVVLRP